MADIYGIGTVSNPYSWQQSPAATKQLDAVQKLSNVVPINAEQTVAPYLTHEIFNPPDFTTFPTLMPSGPMPGTGVLAAPPTAMRPTAMRPTEAPRPPLTAAAITNVNNPVELIRQRLMAVESGDYRKTTPTGNYQAKNPTTSASGAYQYINGTWNNYGGYPEARLAPKHVQDARANEDIARSLTKFRGDPFKVVANHMLPIQAERPDLWARPSTLKIRDKIVNIPPVADYVRKFVKGTLYEAQFEQYLAAHSARPTR